MALHVALSERRVLDLHVAKWMLFGCGRSSKGIRLLDDKSWPLSLDDEALAAQKEAGVVLPLLQVRSPLPGSFAAVVDGRGTVNILRISGSHGNDRHSLLNPHSRRSRRWHRLCSKTRLRSRTAEGMRASQLNSKPSRLAWGDGALHRCLCRLVFSFRSQSEGLLDACVRQETPVAVFLERLHCNGVLVDIGDLKLGAMRRAHR